MQKNGSYQRLIGRKAWMKKTFSCVTYGGYLPFFKDEILPTEAVINSVEALRDYVEITGDDADLLIAKWRDEAAQTTKVPKILTMDHHFGDDSKALSTGAVKASNLITHGLFDRKRKVILKLDSWKLA